MKLHPSMKKYVSEEEARFFDTIDDEEYLRIYNIINNIPKECLVGLIATNLVSEYGPSATEIACQMFNINEKLTKIRDSIV